MKKIENINNETLIKDIFLDKTFIDLFKKFIKTYNGLSISDSNEEKSFLISLLKGENIENSVIIDNFISFFKKAHNIDFFISYVQTINNTIKLDEKTLNLFLEVSDYLIELKNENNKIPEGIDLLSEGINKKIIDIIPRKIEDINLKLLKYGLPRLISNFTKVEKLYEDDFIDFSKGLNKEGIFYKVKTLGNNFCYINNLGEILTSPSNGEIKNIIKYEFFGEYLFINFENNKGEFKSECLFSETRDVVPFGYDEFYKLNILDSDNDKSLNYMYCKTNDLDDPEEILYDEDLSPVYLYDFFNSFYSNLNIDDSNLNIKSYLTQIDVLSINKIYNFEGHIFVGLRIKRPSIINKKSTNEDDEIIETEPSAENIFFSNGLNPLFHNKISKPEIDDLIGFSHILGMKFLQYAIGTNNYFFDSHFNTLKINGKEIQKIEEESLGSTKIFLINDDFLLTEKQLKNELLKYEMFNDGFDMSVCDIYDDVVIQGFVNSDENKINYIYFNDDGKKELIKYEDILLKFTKESNKKIFIEKHKVALQLLHEIKSLDGY